jgi:biotin synthase
MPEDTQIRVSYGTAIVLGLVNARQDVAPTTAYLLFDQGCIGSCSFCPRANGNQQSKRLSRITWPEFSFTTILARLTAEPRPFKRVCLQTGYNPATTPLLKNLARQLINSGIATSMTLSPSQTELALEMLDMGLDHIGIGLDAASEETYREHKRKNWQEDWPALLRLLNKAGERIEVHLIFGLGDSEEAFAGRIQEIVSAGGKISLFALTPVNGGSAPEMSAYRRMQAFRYLCEQGKTSFAACIFAGGRLTSLKTTGDETLLSALNNGEAFRTSGCGNCNRPYYNERPGQKFYNYPRALSANEFSQAFSELLLD